LRAVFFLSIPASVGLIVLSRPLVEMLFERGAFASSSTDAVTWALALFSLGLVGHAGLEIIARAFYALHDTLTPVWVGAVAVGLNVGLSVVLSTAFGNVGWPPHGGLALANSIATLIELALLLWLMTRRMQGLHGRQTLASVARSGVAALAMALALWAWQVALAGASPLVLAGGGILLGGAVYLAVALLVRAEEPRAIVALVRARGQ
jgi:putative peptidoglycan lipid II flippase